MFQISRRVDYALRIMIELALQEGECIPARQISRSTNVPKAFLHKISADLVKANLINTQAGPHGGLMLNQPASEITMQHIVEAIEGPICLNVCLLRPQECKRDLYCPGHDFWGHLQTLLLAELQATRLADLVTQARALAQSPRRRDHIPYVIQGDVIPISLTSTGEQS